MALLISVPAHAQYVWLDDKGNKQFSDMPPPLNVPKNRIIKAPNKTAETSLPAADKPAASTPGNADQNKLEKPVTTASKNEDFMKRRAEQAAKDKKAAEEAQNNADKAKNCERAKSYQKALESGVRIATTGKDGERSYMDDGKRAQELADAKRTMAGCQ
ncbi:DUF4124 domain-containing protein [Undibacterium sp. Jales W-56]|uniref:DUF4124 domain-containing protein n=1 Tax=Undibacterium sp. Jales W-56 TaxID=2897325 RepID=UPI0021D30C5F|nr:DUF4124 domain-containing protein [Undibacterium sp. Jales W-56]MCU6433447.1 DUF4124 domain-containing protein [Undibacterium sp. Jales W-56]